MEHEPEYAPQYSMRERLHHALVGVACGAIVVAVCEWWAFPEFRAFAETAHCRTVLGLPGTTVLMFGIFVGLPLAAAVSIALFVVPLTMRSLRAQQYPPPGWKTHTQVKVRRGRQAQVSAVTLMLVPILLACIALWGGIQASRITSSPKPSSAYPDCETHLERASALAQRHTS
jgi:hypothetical protein